MHDAEFTDADEIHPPPSEMEFAADMGRALLGAPDEATRRMLMDCATPADFARASSPAVHDECAERAVPTGWS